MAETHHPLKPFYSVLVLAFFCSALVAGAAVGLRPLQEANRELDRNRHILLSAGLYQEGRSIDELFAPIKTKIIDLATGEFITDGSIDPKTFNQRQAALSDDQGRALTSEEDIAKISRVEKYSLVYLVTEGEAIKQIILPVRGKGLWSTMYAYVALGNDFSTITGISFYEHGETPGLGGEIENARWQAAWQGKSIFNDDREMALSFARGKAPTEGDGARHQIDGLAGATLTTDGVLHLMDFWFGDHGFGPFLASMEKRNSNNG